MIPGWGAPTDAMLRKFQDETGISVIVNEVAWDDIRDKVSIASLGQSAAADVVEVDWSWVGEFDSADWLEPIQLSKEEQEEMPSIKSFMADDKILALPYANDFRIAYYNTAHFKAAGIEKAPETWEEVNTALKKIKADGIVQYPYTMPLNAEESATTSLIWMALARSGAAFNENNTLKEDAIKDALNYINQMANVDQLVDPAYKTASGMDAYRKILSGEASFMVGPTSFVNRANDPEECKVVVEIMPILLPGIDGTSEKTFALPEGIGVTKFSENKEAAEIFVKWFTSEDIQEEMFQAQNTMPTRTDVLKELINDKEIINSGALLKQSELITSPFPKGIPNHYAEMSNAIYNNVNQMVQGHITPEQAFEEMNDKIITLADSK